MNKIIDQKIYLSLCNEIDRLRSVLRKIKNSEFPRPVKLKYWDNRLPSQHDLCKHAIKMEDPCLSCVSYFICEALESNHEK